MPNRTKETLRVAHAATLVLLGIAGCSSSSSGVGGAADGAASDSGSSSSSSGGSSSGSSSGGTPGDAAGCTYPAGPYGTSVGSILSPTLTWQGFAPGATSPSTIRMTDLFDCDGTKGINALLMDTSAQWCVPCQGEATDIPHWMSASGTGAANWGSLGVQVLTLVIQNVVMGPATTTTALQWRNMFGLTSIYVVADPSVTFSTQGVPYNVLVDPRTMKIVTDFSSSVVTGDDGGGPDAGDDGGFVDPAPPEVAQLAMQNKK
jgi:hypothetical protein